MGVKSSSPSTIKKPHKFKLEPELLLRIHDYMVKSRALEDRLIKMFKQSDGYFWIGGPGEEAFNIPLGLHVKKGQGLDHDFLHLHYRSSGILTAMGMDPLGAIRQMKNTASDPHSGGRNFGNHYSVKEWNVVPVSSTIETQYLTAIGTGIAQKRHGGSGITIVNGGDAGTAEGDFESCLIWSTRPGNELPLLIIVTDNEWGISTPKATQHGEKRIADRAGAYGIQNQVINGNDVEESVFAIREAMAYVRSERKPFFLEVKVSRLYGHSSATGANKIMSEVDCLTSFEEKLMGANLITEKEIADLNEKYTDEFLKYQQQARNEPQPDGSTIYDHVYYGQKGKYW